MKTSTFLVAMGISILLMIPNVSGAQGLSRVVLETAQPQKLNLTVGKSIVVRSPDKVKRVSLAAPETADAMVLTPWQIYLTGKTPGVTNLTLWGETDKVTGVLDLEVGPDVARLRESLVRLFPEEKSIKIDATHDSLTLSGSVSSAAVLSQVLSLTEPFFPKKVVNLMEVSGAQQVMLEVRVAEMSRDLMRRLGFNIIWSNNNGQNFAVSLLNNLTRATPSGAAAGVTDRINSIIGFVSHGAKWTFFIDALKEEGLLKVLAEPTLITLSGKQANFLAGGEFPVPVPQATTAGGQTITIEYKPFGVGLNFTPIVLSSKKINMQIAPEVSDLDFSNAITISGFTIPALTTRRVSTSIELADGQTFAIAGLIRDNNRQIVSKFPVLGDIPVMGALFRSTEFQKNESELVIIATPHLVKPLDLAKQTLPTDQYVEPDDIDFYLHGRMEGRKEPSNPSVSTEKKRFIPEGGFGHVKPKEESK